MQSICAWSPSVCVRRQISRSSRRLDRDACLCVRVRVYGSRRLHLLLRPFLPSLLPLAVPLLPPFPVASAPGNTAPRPVAFKQALSHESAPRCMRAHAYGPARARNTARRADMRVERIRVCARALAFKHAFSGASDVMPNPTPHTLHLHPTPYSLLPTPYTLHPRRLFRGMRRDARLSSCTHMRTNTHLLNLKHTC